ncbi:acetoacetyl-CoA synthase [Aspergillus carlsbadensis]|nr:acetoacetyl-CoA synthase [Aspergillus carlsbadensis]
MATTKSALWRPQSTQDTTIAKFITFVNERTVLNLKTYEDVHRWSIDPSTCCEFWGYAYTFLGLPSDRDTPLAMPGPAQVMFPRPTFFPSQSLNLAELILQSGRDDDIAIYFAREQHAIEQVTWKGLRQRTASARSALLGSGVGRGDRVAAVISNSVDAIVLCLAALSIGALWSSASCDLGAKAIVDRLSQVRPRVVFADNGYTYAGKRVDLLGRIGEWAAELAGREGSGLRDVVLLPTLQGSEESVGRVSKGVTWAAFLQRGTGEPLGFDRLPFDHPAFILFSSGTTGAPKCIVHSAGGVALKAKVDSQLQHDMRPGDVIFQYTTTAWVMWVLNFVNLSNNISMLLYDGSPFHPGPEILLKLIAKVGVTVFGTSPRYMAELKSRGIMPRTVVDLSKLRVVTSTGAALSSEMYNWFYDTAFPRRTHLISMSGGTDLCGSLVGGTPLLPVYAGEIQAKCLGMAVDIASSANTSAQGVQDGVAGELVCTLPFPSQPLTFWGPGGDEKYRTAYFDRFGPGVWCQGDFAQVQTDTKGIKMLGRSDGVLNPSGVRFGSAEIYAVVDEFPEIEDCVCVGQRREFDEDEAVLLFVVMKPGVTLSARLIGSLQRAVCVRYSPRHVPTQILQVAAIPYTVNGKKCEINVKQTVNGMAAAVWGAVANPESLKEFEQYYHLPKHVIASKKTVAKL